MYYHIHLVDAERKTSLILELLINYKALVDSVESKNRQAAIGILCDIIEGLVNLHALPSDLGRKLIGIPDIRDIEQFKEDLSNLLRT